MANENGEGSVTAPERRYVVLVENKGYIQPRRKFGPLETALRFTDREAAIAAGMRVSKGNWIEAIEVAS